MGAIRDELKAKEAVKEAAQRKRGTALWSATSCSFVLTNISTICHADKLEDAKAKAAIKAQIEADKRERAEKAAREKALRQGAQLPSTEAPSASAVPSSTAGKDYKETRLQVLVIFIFILIKTTSRSPLFTMGLSDSFGLWWAALHNHTS